MSQPPAGAVFDCVVLVQAAANRHGPAAACLRLVDDGRLALIASPPTLAELGEVLRRPRLRERLRTLTPEVTGAFLEELSRKVVTVTDVPARFTYPRDPKDEPYVNLALAAGARYLVTWDRDLLDLMEDNPAGIDFRKRFPDLEVAS
jgi:putative PIN family toxin of toxin-antitoxin system